MPYKQSPKVIETERIPRENVVLKKAGVILVVEHLPSTFKALSLISSIRKKQKVGCGEGRCQRLSADQQTLGNEQESLPLQLSGYTLNLDFPPEVWDG